MRGFAAKCLVANRETVIVILVLLIVRTFQLITINQTSFAAATELAPCYSVTTSLSLAAFALVPLFALYLVSSLKTVNNINFYTRLSGRASSVYCFLLLSIIKSFILSFTINITSLIILLAKCPLSFLSSEYLYAFSTSIILECLFFLVCSLLMLTVYLLTREIFLAAIALLFYGVWDYLITYVPFLSNSVMLGWSLTSLPMPFSLFNINVKVMPFLAYASFLTLAGLVIIQRNDLIKGRRGESDV